MKKNRNKEVIMKEDKEELKPLIINNHNIAKEKLIKIKIPITINTKTKTSLKSM